MKKLRMAFFAVIGILMTATAAMAQTTTAAADNDFTRQKYLYIAAGFGFALAAAAGAIGQSRVAASAVEGVARNPGASGRIQTLMILGLALIESLVLFALLIVFAKIK
ncbi:MAG: F-type H+-transporting ATPase subunit c [Acidobacteriota bacterium]|jgi:F-type H+-transporting ATPase subunit c|nr:F-type H+-transporting ATPase subunit c [Acidobacteriota bacterium]